IRDRGLPCYPAVDDIGGPVDMAICFVPARDVPSAVEARAAKGIKGVMIESGGFAETGADGVALQQRLVAIRNATGIRLWGPNCMGLVDAVHGHVFSFMDPTAFQDGLLIPGQVSLIVQSGMLSAGFLVDIMTHGVMGISKVCSVGNKIDVDECDLLPWLLADEHTAVVGLYLESLLKGRTFLHVCREARKPIVVLMGGRSRAGAQAAMSHTASLAGNSAVISGALAQAGVWEARDFHQLMDLCRTLALRRNQQEIKRGRMAILTFSGGAGIVSSDFLEEAGLPIATLTEATKANLGKLFPAWMPVHNPVDLWPAMERHASGEVNVLSRAVAAVLADPGVDGVFVHVFVGNFRIHVDIDELAHLSRTAGKPLFVWLLGRREHVFMFQNKARDAGIATFREIGRAVECIKAFFKAGYR
ncbi:MAG: CoA-binding protein, partial [Syntrophales bacterium]|nr:CoA-binding protein [Syntrophales bacterium]